MKKVLVCMVVIVILVACDSPAPKKYSGLPEPLPELEGGTIVSGVEVPGLPRSSGHG